MSTEERELRAAEYVLGTLDAESRGRFQEELDEDSALRDLVEAWERRLVGLDREAAATALPAGLWERIEGDLDSSQNITLRAEEGAWQRLGAGVEKKLLFSDPTIGCESYLLRLAPGTCLPNHHHKLAEECLMIEGDLSIGDLRLRAGDYHAAQPGSEHPEIATEHGALVYIRGEIRAA